MARRSYGSGRLYVHRDSGGGESWYGTWYSDGRRVNRKIGPKRSPGSREGLTAAQAERELHRRIDSERPVIRSRLAVASAGEHYIEHLEHVLERKPTTIGDYRSMLRRHIEPFFGDRPLERIDADQIRRYLGAKKREGLATKTITNQLVFLHGLFSFSLKRGWLNANPVAMVDRPRAPVVDPDIRYLHLDELDATLSRDVRRRPRFARSDDLSNGVDDRYAAGELIALRWVDVDWRAARIRVRRTTHARDSGHPNPSAPHVRCRWPTASRPA